MCHCYLTHCTQYGLVLEVIHVIKLANSQKMHKHANSLFPHLQAARGTNKLYVMWFVLIMNIIMTFISNHRHGECVVSEWEQVLHEYALVGTNQ